MKILYLCNKKTYDTKMSRVRFHSMGAIESISTLTYSGLGWGNYNENLTAQENIDLIYSGDAPDLVIGYKPLELNGFASIKAKKCIRYNEMWDKRWTKKEILGSDPDVIVCHHKNDMESYQEFGDKLINISHCAESSIYRDYGLEKEYDILFTGAVSRHYPFRRRLKGLLPKLQGHAKCKVLGHPGGNLNSSKGLILEDYAKLINKSKITLTCSSKYRYRLGKYVEIPMCGSVLAGDLPDEDHDFFKKFMLVVDQKMSDNEIVKKILDCLSDHESLRKKAERGIELNKDFTQMEYAKRFVNLVEEKIKKKEQNDE